MVNSLLFRWEGSQALQHHCGFCERPLSHPGARASCFGTHNEPCHRFHQAMFMRNRAHICNYCETIDEAHYKRHRGLAEQLHSIYESCGEAEWTIMPVEPEDPRRDRSFDTQMTYSESSDRSLASEETTTSKRERKDAKCLARAASRTKVVTHEEIQYVDSVIHSSEGVANGEGVSPANVEEMQLIEQHLRYNANVYNSHSSRKALKRFAKIPEVDVNFESEVERVLETFRITELVKRNFRNRGLQGKELRNFERLVDAFRNAVVEDLVLVKKDMMEIRMRRAGYLRYTNKTAYNIVENRYAEKDWKTGERIISSASESSSLSSPSDELISSPVYVPIDVSLLVDPNARDSDIYEPPNGVQSCASGPDQRHLQHIHTRISGDDGLGQAVIEPYHAPLLPLAPNANLRKPTILQLKVVENRENNIPAGKTNRGWLQRDVARQSAFVQPVSLLDVDEPTPSPTPTKPSASGTASTSIKPAWGRIPSNRSPRRLFPRVDEHHFPSLGLTAGKALTASIASDVLAVQPPADDITISLQGPERLVAPIENKDKWHPVVSQKKAKKTQREAKRKAKKVSESSRETLSPTAEEEAGFDQVAQEPFEGPPSGLIDCEASSAMDKMTSHSPNDSIVELTVDDKDGVSIIAAEEQVTVVDAPSEPSSTPLPHTTHRKHDHWTRFHRKFAVDQLTVPLLQSLKIAHMAHHANSRVKACLIAPFTSHCHIMYPGKQPCSAGPFNRAHGQRLIAMYEQQELTRGRVMLVDDDLVPYFLDFNTAPGKPGLGSMPPRLLREHEDFLKGYERGALMKQEIEFERLFLKNMTLKHDLTSEMLQAMQRKDDSVEDAVQLCYCRSAVLPKVSEIRKGFGNGYVRCSYRKCEFGGFFHKRCVKKLGVEKVSRWYCTACEKKMKIWAYKALNIPNQFDDLFKDFSDEEKGVAKKLLAQMTQPGGVMDQFKSRLQELYAGEVDEDLEEDDVH